MSLQRAAAAANLLLRCSIAPVQRYSGNSIYTWTIEKPRRMSPTRQRIQYVCVCVCPKEQTCIQSVTVVLDEDVSRQITLTRDGEVIIGVNPASVLPYTDGKHFKKLR